MNIHKWRKRPTKYFGEVLVPFAHIQVRSDDKSPFQTLALQMDSGAVVSLLRRSVADVLQLDWESGRRIALSGVGGGSTSAYVHHLHTRFTPGIELQVPFAISDTERVPNLLGRLGVFDAMQIHFDPTFAETNILAPWLSGEERRIWDLMLSTERYILDRWRELQWSDGVKDALNSLLTRGQQLVATAAALLRLHRTFDGLLVVRTLFEHAAQSVYMLQDAEARAGDYLDYQHVTRRQYSQRFLSASKGPIAELLRRSPLRAAGEQRNREEFDRISGRFARERGGMWDRWYCKPLLELSREIGWEGEYRLWYAAGSGWSHGDPHFSRVAAHSGQTERDELFVMAYIYYGRMLRAISERLSVPEHVRAFFKHVSETWS